MLNSDDMIHTQDMAHLWHPCSQMKDYETFKPLIVNGAQGSYIELSNKQLIIDAHSSWWCKNLGHQHPRLQQALIQQAQRFEHVALGNITYDTIVELSQRLAQLMPQLNKVFYANDGACAIEIALKMSIHARQIKGETHRQHFLALEHAYHGETLGALSVSNLGLYAAPYQSLMFKTPFIQPLPYVNSIHDPLWNDCTSYWNEILPTLELYAQTATAIIVEPIVQGSAGMKIYSQHFLKLLRDWTRKHDIHLIADEMMTGFGRTGAMLACEHAQIIPDFLCLGKGLTAGWLAMSAVLTSDDIYQLFYADYEENRTFIHSHTYSGNALAARIALEVMTIFEEENICAQAKALGKQMLAAMHNIATSTQRLENVRGIGAIVAADLITEPHQRRLGYEIYQHAVKLGALLRPLGNTIYWLPPLNMSLATLQELHDITEKAIMLSCQAHK